MKNLIGDVCEEITKERLQIDLFLLMRNYHMVVVRDTSTTQQRWDDRRYGRLHRDLNQLPITSPGKPKKVKI